MKEWLSGIVGESAANIVGFILIFAIILGGIFVVLSIIRRFSGGTFVSNGRTRQPRLSVMDAAAVDSRRKLVLIRRDDVEHLLLIGGPTDVVVEQNIVMESRAHARVQASRIEPEHIERFKQHEATLTNEKAERPALPLQTPQVEEKDEAIQLTSAIETPAYRKPEPAREEPVQQAAAPVRVPPQAPPTAPIPPRSPVEPKSAQPVQSRPQPRPAPNYPPQPRTVLPPRPAPAQPQSTRAHPAYPLSQVSRGVLSSTSSGATAAAGVAAAASVTSANLGSIVPERETTATDKSPSVDVTGPTVSSTAAPAFSTPSEPNRIEPEITLAEPKPVESEAVTAETSSDDLTNLGGALHSSITADVNSDSAASDDAKDAISFDAEFFENELLSSLDISATDDTIEDKAKDDIEDEMEKLLGELTKDEIRRS
ncbi:flagellar biosynthetic protein FliO [Brucella oryzae]|uniref:flagellar biosynthetic protein FliO n=1 Tax=Brucella oryzae TaxID=335286 RepID=UPI001B821C27|nr:flagellar biosynthetic protein FliO [Brucella oryzae]MBR7654648.1 flagellar biosynthetic protein FliO [Brucella oryzae]